MRIVLDIETDSLNPTKIWVAVIKNIDTNEIKSFRSKELFRQYIKENPITLLIAHNGIFFDLFWLEKLWGISFDRDIVRDTLVLSRLYNQRLEGGHSLDEWGVRLKFPKGEFDRFNNYSEEMLKSS